MTDTKEFERTYPIKIEEFKQLIDPEYSSVKLSEFPENKHIVVKLTKFPTVRTHETKKKEIMRTQTFPVSYKYKEHKVNLFFRVGEGAFVRFAMKYADMKEIQFDEDPEKSEYQEMQSNHITQTKEGMTKYYEITKWREEEFVDKYAFFSKTVTTMKIDGKTKAVYPQFINVIQKEGFEPTDFKSALDTFKEIDKEASAEEQTVNEPDNVENFVKEDMSQKVMDFVVQYKVTMEQYNTMAKEKNEEVKVVSAKDCMIKYMKTVRSEEYAMVVKAYKETFKKE